MPSGDNPKSYATLKLGHGWNKGLSKANGDSLVYGKPRSEETKKLISQRLSGRTFTLGHRQNIAKARLESFDKRGRKPLRIHIDGRKYQMWRKTVLERDKYTCQQCQSTKQLQTHHVKTWNKYPELRYDVNNGLTLCVECHRKTDSWGYKNGRG